MTFLDEIPIRSGVDEAWFNAVVLRSETAIRQAVDALTPVQIRQARVELPLGSAHRKAMVRPERRPGADDDGMDNGDEDLRRWRAAPRFFARESQLPGIVDPTLQVVAFEALDTGVPHVVLLGWGAAPNFAGKGSLLSADYVGRVRQHAEANWPGSTALWLTSAAADSFVTGAQVTIPAVNLDGRLVDGDGQEVDSPAEAVVAAHPMEALANYLVSRARRALEQAEVQPARLEKTSRSVWVPLSNPLIASAAWLGVLPIFHDWMVGGVPTAAWVGPDRAPTCGGHGCLRYRLDKLTLNSTFTLMSVPGALDQAFVHGRPSQEVMYRDARNLRDLDGDGTPDAEDDEILVTATVGRMVHQYVLDRPANPQRFEAIGGLGGADIWVVGRTNGGVGSFRASEDVVNVFEGQLEGAIRFGQAGLNGELMLCNLGYPCDSELTLAGWLRQLIAAQPDVLADIRVSHELWCQVDMPEMDAPVRWRLTDLDGVLLAEGDDLVLGPGNRVFSISTDFGALSMDEGAELWLPTMGDEPWRVGGVVAVELRWHPNAGDAWRSISVGGGGNLIYNAACELKADGPCEMEREVRQDPNAHLPRSP